MHTDLIYVAARELAYELPHGDTLFSNLTFAINRARYALVGANGVGKSTLAKILAGIIPSAKGEVIAARPVVYLEQISLPPVQTVGEYLAEMWESPWISPEVWGPLLQDISLEASLSSLSGGEWMRVRIAQVISRSEGVLILDEPTNNLDVSARTIISDFIQNYSGALLLISHDRDLLEKVDVIWELSNQGLSVYGGNYSFYREQREAERELQRDTLDRLRREKKKVEREHQEKLQAQEKRSRRGEKMGDSGSLPRILVGGLKRQAEQSYGRIQNNEQKRVDKAQGRFRNFYEGMKEESSFQFYLPAPDLPQGKLIFEVEDFNVRWPGQSDFMWRHDLSFSFVGPQRWALIGDNGVGKSTFIKIFCQTMRDEILTRGVLRRGAVQYAILDQNYSSLKESESVLENVKEASDMDRDEIRNRLAQFQLRGDKPLQMAGSLSGGEKMKAALAKALFAAPTPQLLVLDEPTNNLDIESLEVLEGVLKEYQGALLVVSHDQTFLKNIGVHHAVHLERRK
ncbi:MAG: ATP-binding cassette domain-containing protein [Bdellovibrio sp.]